MNKNLYFDWSDAWVFTALYASNPGDNAIDLPMLISAGDLLNHAIPEMEEIKTGFIKFQRRGLMQIINNTIKYTDLGKLISVWQKSPIFFNVYRVNSLINNDTGAFLSRL